MKTKITKESRNLLIGMLLGDGTISNNNVFKIAHAESQKDYLEWKIKQLKEFGIRNNGVKSYIKTKGYNINVPVYYTQLNTIPFIKVLRRVCYKEKKIIGNRKLLNRLGAREIAIWYMDDGSKDKRRSKGCVLCTNSFTKKDLIEVCKILQNKFQLEISIRKNNTLYIKSKSFDHFVSLIKPYIIPSMLYKIQ